MQSYFELNSKPIVNNIPMSVFTIFSNHNTFDFLLGSFSEILKDEGKKAVKTVQIRGAGLKLLKKNWRKLDLFTKIEYD